MLLPFDGEIKMCKNAPELRQSQEHPLEKVHRSRPRVATLLPVRLAKNARPGRGKSVGLPGSPIPPLTGLTVTTPCPKISDTPTDKLI